MVVITSTTIIIIVVIVAKFSLTNTKHQTTER